MEKTQLIIKQLVRFNGCFNILTQPLLTTVHLCPHLGKRERDLQQPNIALSLGWRHLARARRIWRAQQHNLRDCQPLGRHTLGNS